MNSFDYNELDKEYIEIEFYDRLDFISEIYQPITDELTFDDLEIEMLYSA